ncbi:MAG: DUF350 domain-containing protein [Deferribacteres bacterium]|nr:DUF350 domain-containing protein [candidate division KSB1 bacterium]MCB9501830.1 DUF350 domain-containing protein [Deferribacteres bacterium]
MSLDQVVTGIIYLVATFIIFLLGKWVFNKFNSHYDLHFELLKNDNFALALAVTGYYLGLIFALGGVLDGPSKGWTEDLIDILFYGIFAIILLNIAGIINEKIILSKFSLEDEIIRDRNAGAGAISGGNYLAAGLVVAGAIQGEGDLMTAIVFWLIGQAVLILASRVYDLITPFDVHEHIEKDNIAVGVAFAGVLIAFGNIIRISIYGDFISWRANLTEFGTFVLFGLIMLPIVRFITDKLLLPGEKLTDELVNQEKPNVGAGVIEAFSYIAASLLLGWVV